MIMGKRRRNIWKIFVYAFLLLVTLVMVYPLLWMFFSSFKSTNEIFGSTSLLPIEWKFGSYSAGWVGTGQYTYTTFYLNTLKVVVPVIAFTLISSVLVAYGFARFEFKFKSVIFALLIMTLFLPGAVLIVPRYLLFKNLDWLNSYLPLVVPSAFASSAFFVYMLIQFFRGIPKDLDESAKIDGCNSFMILLRIFLPLSGPAMVSVTIFQFIWTWNNFFDALIYINSVSKYTVALGLRMSLDVSLGYNWANILAMSVLAVLPGIIIYAFCQKAFVEGISTTGIKG